MLTRLLFCIIYLMVSVKTVSNAAESQCSSIKRNEIELHLSSNTPYRVVANNEDKPFEYPGCKATRIWSVNRHGARNPSKKIIIQAQKELTQLKKRILENKNTMMCSDELEKLKYWKFNVSVEEEKYLVAEGEDELIKLAERMQNRFPDILPDTYDSVAYYFKYTATQRTLESAKSFASGLFGQNRVRDIVYPEAMHRDPILRWALKPWADNEKTPYSFQQYSVPPHKANINLNRPVFQSLNMIGQKTFKIKYIIDKTFGNGLKFK